MKYHKFAAFSGCILTTLLIVACTPKKETSTAVPTPAATGAVANSGEEIRFGTDATYAPIEFTTPSGEIVGFDIDLAKAMCEEIKAKCTFTNQAWEGLIPGLNAKKFDVIAAGMSITEARKQEILFTQKLWEAPNRFVAKAGSTLQTTPEGLKGKSIGVQQATVQEAYAKKHYPDSTIKSYKTIEDSYNDLIAKRIDVVFADGVVITEGFLKKPAGKDYAQLGADISSTADPMVLGEGKAFAVRKGDTALAEKLNKGFEAIRANGKYKAIADKYFTFDIYGSK